jgi:hypothetical protein
MEVALKGTHLWVTNLYLLNFALLFTHEIDSAYWQEWEMFGIPGGIKWFLVVNFVLLLLALVGFRLLIEGRRGGYAFSLLLAASGIAAFPIHAAYVLTGHEEFRTAISWIFIGAILAVSLVQGFLTVRDWGRES